MRRYTETTPWPIFEQYECANSRASYPYTKKARGRMAFEMTADECECLCERATRLSAFLWVFGSHTEQQAASGSLGLRFANGNAIVHSVNSLPAERSCSSLILAVIRDTFASISSGPRLGCWFRTEVAKVRVFLSAVDRVNRPDGLLPVRYHLNFVRGCAPVRYSRAHTFVRTRVSAVACTFAGE